MSAQRVDTWIANSQEVAARIKKFYRREALVVYPPVESKGASSTGQVERGDYYLLVTRITGAKGVIETMSAAQNAGFKLKLVGEIVENRLKKMIERAGENVEYVGRVGDSELGKLYANARGFIALARDEDFGMTVVEAMGHGVPVLALNSGGYKETVKEGMTGYFVKDAKVESIVLGIRKMDKTKWNKSRIVSWAREFDRSNFETKMKKIIGN